MRQLIFNNWPYKVISLILGVMFSYYIYGFSSYEVEVPISLPVEVTNLSSRLAIASSIPDKITIMLKGTPSSISEYRSLGVSATLDLSVVSEPGTYVITPDFSLLENLKLVNPVRPVKVQIDSYLEKQIKVEYVQKGQLPEGYVLGEVEVKPSEVSVSGPKSIVSQVAHVVGELDLTGRRTRIVQSVPLSITDERFIPIRAQAVSLNPASAFIRAEIKTIASVTPLSIRPSLEGEPAAGYFVKSVTIEPSQVLLDTNLLPKNLKLTYLSTEEIPLSGVSASFEAIVKVKYPFKRTEALPESVAVRVTIEKLAESEHLISLKPEVIGERDNFTYHLTPEVITVESPDLSLLLADERNAISAWIDVSKLEAGTYQVVPTVALPASVKRVRILPSTISLEVLPSSEG